jgi:hypothetical protein
MAAVHGNSPAVNDLIRDKDIALVAQIATISFSPRFTGNMLAYEIAKFGSSIVAL